MNVKKKVRDWCLAQDIWNVKLDIEVPKVCFVEAMRLYEEGFFVTHREGTGHGWKSSALWGWAPKDGSLEDAWKTTTNPKGVGLKPKEVQWGWTGIQEIAPETKRWLSQFPGNHLRCRFMLLEPGGYIEPHTDHPHRTIWGAVNVAFNQPEDCYLRRTVEGDDLPYEPFSAYYFDKGVLHEARNNSNRRRYHFIISGSPCVKSYSLMLRSLEKEHGLDLTELLSG